MLSTFRELEGMPDREAMMGLEEILKDYVHMLLPTKSGRGRTKNTHYLSRGGRYVTTFIENRFGRMEVCIYDKDLYDKYCVKMSKSIALNNKGGTKQVEPVINFPDYPNVQIHRLTFGWEYKKYKKGDLFIDHRFMTHRYAATDGLRFCEGYENSMNQPCRSHLMDGNSFYCEVGTVSDDVRLILVDKGYVVKSIGDFGYRIEKRGCAEVYQDIKFMEELVFGEFRYNPLIDFTDTWYALILWKMLDIPESEVMEYQRKYMLENHPERAEYYMLAA